MIGMIALAGIVVRNSIILIDFIHHSLARGLSLDDAILEAGAMRLRPILLTAGAAMLGSAVITLDPIFSGLAWSLHLRHLRLDRIHAGRGAPHLLSGLSG